MKHAIAYIRVSTDAQLAGHGPEWQLKQIQDYANAKNLKIVWTPTESHTGNGSESVSDRPVLQSVLRCARKRNIPILVADIDRLGRHHESVMDLYRSGLIIDVSEGEKVDEAVISAKALNAQRRGEVIRETTRNSLAPLKGTGRLGNKTNLPEAQKLGADENKRRADVRAMDFLKVWQQIDPSGQMNRKALADAMNARGMKTPSGKPWTISNIRRIMKRSRELVLVSEQIPVWPNPAEDGDDIHKNDPLWGIFA